MADCNSLAQAQHQNSLIITRFPVRDYRLTHDTSAKISRKNLPQNLQINLVRAGKPPLKSPAEISDQFSPQPKEKPEKP